MTTSFQVWVTIPSDGSRSGYLSANARSHDPATWQTTSITSNGAVFSSLEEAENTIIDRGWLNDTRVIPGRVTAYVVRK